MAIGLRRYAVISASKLVAAIADRYQMNVSKQAIMSDLDMSDLDLFFDRIPEFKKPSEGLVGRVNPGGLWQPVDVNRRRQM